MSVETEEDLLGKGSVGDAQLGFDGFRILLGGRDELGIDGGGLGTVTCSRRSSAGCEVCETNVSAALRSLEAFMRGSAR